MLPYTAEVLFSLHARHLRELWPAALPLVLLTLAVVLVLPRRGPAGSRVTGALLAPGWLWVGSVFHLQYFATINFAAPLYGWLFVLQAALLAWQGPVRGGLALRLRTDWVGWLGMLLVVYAVAGYPLLDYLAARPADGPRLAGLAPGPTTALTLGVLLHCHRRTPLHLMVLPVLWSAAAGYAGWVLGLPADLVLPVLALAALAAAVAKNRAGPA